MHGSPPRQARRIRPPRHGRSERCNVHSRRGLRQVLHPVCRPRISCTSRGGPVHDPEVPIWKFQRLFESSATHPPGQVLVLEAQGDRGRRSKPGPSPSHSPHIVRRKLFARPQTARETQGPLEHDRDRRGRAHAAGQGSARRAQPHAPSLPRRQPLRHPRIHAPRAGRDGADPVGVEQLQRHPELRGPRDGLRVHPLRHVRLQYAGSRRAGRAGVSAEGEVRDNEGDFRGMQGARGREEYVHGGGAGVHRRAAGNRGEAWH
mmetsp:Transcript_12236/g.30867  ORF Transcript_12236/g.30867 Transcript_12236/m.30867 type:complete len:261 (+) Transcript_12236:267-1049(+)